jgi:predicted nucleic acid-binding protein
MDVKKRRSFVATHFSASDALRQPWRNRVRSLFPGHFRPSEDGFSKLWESCLFAVDANVLLNLYRYSPETRNELEKTLESLKERLFVPRQAAKEFLKNRLTVTPAQAGEYTKAIDKLADLTSTLANKKKHPFLAGEKYSQFSELVPKLIEQLEAQRSELFSRLVNDEILESVEKLFAGRTGSPLPDEEFKKVVSEGEQRYQNDMPPGYRDGKKDPSGDPYRKYGDLIVWKQIIKKAKEDGKAVVFITDDKKDDWWQEQSGRTVGPRTELRDEFIDQTSNDFWMYTVDKFMEEAARATNTQVNQEAIAEIIEISETAKAEQADETQGLEKIIRPVLSKEDILGELEEFLESHPSDDGGVGLRYFVVTYLGSQNYEINHSYARLNALQDSGLVDIYKREKNGAITTRVRIKRNDG